MKLLELRLKNLNSLYGEWKIDFKHCDYEDNGIFALTGPTGAGKSTILDAICLALYGATPRLDKITKSNNEIISKGCSECYAEIAFQTHLGSYRVHWAQHRSHNRADGSLQTPKHEIADAINHQIIESKASLVPKVVEQKTGMNFNRFTRAILLAQGQFNQFLKANIEQKSEILEQITGTEIYSTISILVFERQREENTKRQALEQGIALIKLLDDTEEQQLQQQLLDYSDQLQTLQQTFTTLQKEKQWQETIHRLMGEIKALDVEKILLNSEISRFAPQKEHLKWGQKAQLLENSYQSLQTLSQEIEQNKQQLTRKKTHLNQGKDILIQRKTYLDNCSEQLKQAQLSYEQGLKICTEVRHLDNALHNYKVQLDSRKNLSDVIQQQLSELNLKKSWQKQAIEHNHQQLKTLTEFLNQQAGDAILSKELSGLKQILNTLADKNNLLSHYSDQQTAHQKALETQQQQINKFQEQSHQAVAKKTALEKKRQNLFQALQHLLNHQSLADYRAQQTELLNQLTLAHKIQSLESERQQLMTGEPCPLCGAIEHPYTIGSTKTVQTVNKELQQLNLLLNQAEALQHDIVTISQKLEQMLADRTLEQQQQALSQALEHTHLKIEYTESNIIEIKKEIKQLTELLTEKLAHTKITFYPREKNTTALLNELQDRVTTWESKKESYQKLSEKNQQLHIELDVIEKEIAYQHKELTRLTQEYHQTFTLYQEKKQQRERLLGQEEVDTFEQSLKHQLNDLCHHYQILLKRYENSQKKVHVLEGSIKILDQKISHRTQQLEKQSNEFSTLLTQNNFNNLNHFLDSRLASNELDDLIQQDQELTKRSTDLTNKYEDRQTRLLSEQAKNLTTESLETIELNIEQNQHQKDEINQIIGQINTKLNDNHHAKTHYQQQIHLLTAQKKEFDKWNLLYQLIGSADGKKYRNIAQRLTFELMLANANLQLQQMNDRYLLVQNTQELLTLDVIDNYQAGTIRSSKNLSGGESFIASLALALGLSNMVSQNFKMDCLFLDEGFGTLDEETLETALDTLANLNQEGKLIGIVSHIPALKDRISVQIKVKPLAGGKSALSGSGVTRIG